MRARTSDVDLLQLHLREILAAPCYEEVTRATLVRCGPWLGLRGIKAPDGNARFINCSQSTFRAPRAPVPMSSQRFWYSASYCRRGRTEARGQHDGLPLLRQVDSKPAQCCASARAAASVQRALACGADAGYLLGALVALCLFLAALSVDLLHVLLCLVVFVVVGCEGGMARK